MSNGITKATVYEYDSFGRLMRVKNDGEIKTTYYYDTNGNRTHRCTPETGCIELHYNAQDQLTKYGTNTYTYTLNGELKTKGNPEGVTVYDHDPMGNLVQVILPNSTVIGYTYDGKNRRVAKMVNGFITERLIYKDQLAPIAKVDADGNVLEEYVYGTGINSPDYIRKDGVNYRVIKDHLGSVRMIDNASTGEIVKEIEYDEFGNIAEETGTFETIFGFAGGIRDTDSDLTKFGARWYDPETGRWIKKDPIMFDGGLNHYAYCEGDPVNYVDVSGLVLTPIGTDEEKKKILMALTKLSIYSPTAKELIFHLEISEKVVKIEMADRSTHYKGLVTWAEVNSNITEPWEIGVPSEIWLGHELIHALHYIHGVQKPDLNTGRFNLNIQPEEYFTTGLDGSLYPFTENRIRKDYMKYYPELTFRDYYYTGGFVEYEKNKFNPVVCY